MKSEKLESDLAHLLPDYGYSRRSAIIPRLLGTLKRALGERVKLIQLCHSLTTKPVWEARSPPPSLETQPLQFGLILNQEHAYSPLTKGPQAQTPAGDDFRQFWGSLSEIRRFQNGQICEAIHWGEVDDHKGSVLDTIVRHILKRHFNLTTDDVKTNFVWMHESLMMKSIKLVGKNGGEESYGTGERFASDVLIKMNSLKTKLFSLSGASLPFSVVEVVGADDSFVGTEVGCKFAMILA